VTEEAENPELNGLVEEADARFGRMAFLRTDAILGRCLRQYGEWAQAELDLMCDLLRPDGVALDVGAYIGTHTLAFARHTAGAGRVVAFEPQPVFFSLLRRNVVANGLTNVQLLNIALAERSREMMAQTANLALEGNFGGTSLATPRAGTNPAPVQARSLDDLSMEQCDLIKLDVEGMEALVLAGARNTIERYRPVVYAECNSADAGWPVVETMRAHEYDAYAFIPLAFNPDNFRGSSENFMGRARELGLLFVPALRRERYAQALTRHRPLAPLGSIDDLVLALLRKPQYKSEVVAHGRAAAVLGTDFWSAEAEAEQIAEIRARLEQTQAHALQCTDQLARTQAALEQAQQLAWSRYREIEETRALAIQVRALRRSWKARWALALSNGRVLAADPDSRPGSISTFLTNVVENRLFESQPTYAKVLSIGFQPDSYADHGLHAEFEELYECFTKGDPYRGMDTARLWSALLNLKRVLESTDGSLAEVGVDKGNFSAVLGWFARRHARRLYMLDTFSGFPEGQLDGDERPGVRAAFRDTSLEIAKRTVGDSPLFQWVVGTFPESATRELLSDRFCFVSLDCDLYEPIRAGLRIFWERLVPGGMIFVHDYSSNHWPGAKRAVDEFLKEEAGAVGMLLPDKSGTIVVTKARRDGS
jgi:FkbM family methyltransferase